jgi:phosphatidyl-myo-inositol alpha-mannosyltransferase
VAGVRVLQACPYAWEAAGGVQTHVRQLAATLIARGHEVAVIAPGRRPPGEPHVRLAGRPLRFRYQGTVAPIAPSPRAVRRVRRLVRSFRPDVVHVHEPLTPSTAMFATLVSPAPVVATFHAFAERSRLFDVAAPAVRPVWRRLAIRLAVSRAAAAFVSARLEGEVRVLPNGVDVELFGRAEPASDLPPGRRILWVNRLDPQKGFPVAVRAFADLASDLDEVWLVVAGDGRDRDAVDLLPGLARERVLMLGRVEHADLPPLHAASDVFVSPAVGQESFGIVLVEAMAAGLPVVASDIEGYREIVRRGIEGLLVPPGDPAALAGAIRRVLGEPALARRLSEAGRARAGQFSWETVAARIEHVYEEAMAQGTG